MKRFLRLFYRALTIGVAWSFILLQPLVQSEAPPAWR